MDAEGRWTGARKMGWRRPSFRPRPPWFQDNRDFPRSAEGLRRAGFGESEIAGVLGENWYRFYARSLRASTGAASKPGGRGGGTGIVTHGHRRFHGDEGRRLLLQVDPGARDAIDAAAFRWSLAAIERMQRAR